MTIVCSISDTPSSSIQRRPSKMSALAIFPTFSASFDTMGYSRAWGLGITLFFKTNTFTTSLQRLLECTSPSINNSTISKRWNTTQIQKNTIRKRLRKSDASNWAHFKSLIIFNNYRGHDDGSPDQQSSSQVWHILFAFLFDFSRICVKIINLRNNWRLLQIWCFR